MESVQPDDVAMVATKLQELGDRFIFVGGCVLPFLVDRPFVPVVRPTVDVDVVVEVITRLDYSKLEERLRGLGFRHDTRVGAHRCGWLVAGVEVDVMPTSPKAAEFGSRRFEMALENAESHEIVEGVTANTAGPSYLLATKMDAFFSRGSKDYHGSVDLEDIVTLIEGCSRLLAELQTSPEELRQHVSKGMRRLLASQDFIESIQAHLSPEAPGGTVERVVGIARRIAEGA